MEKNKVGFVFISFFFVSLLTAGIERRPHYACCSSTADEFLKKIKHSGKAQRDFHVFVLAR